MTITIAQRDTIEIIALKGKAVASLLGTACPLDECSTEDIQLALYALEQYFSEILSALEALEAHQPEE
jgi:hypothetical protein